MATRIKSWQIVDGKLQPVEASLAQAGRTEAKDLETWLESEPSVLGEDLILIGRQVMTQSGPLDLLAIDRSGNLVVVELKREKLPREALTQAIDYASDVANWSVDRLSEVCVKYSGKDIDDALSEGFPDLDLENLHLNESQRILLVGFEIESALERMVTWLSSSYGMDINAVLLHYVRTAAGDELLSCTALIPEEVAETRSRKRKFQVPMSDEPGSFDQEELRGLMNRYLSKDMVTAQRIRKVLLPACLEHGTVTRDVLLDEFVRRGEAENTTAAGYYVTLVSSQLGMEKNSFLRQVIAYEYPRHEWAKDNYRIREGHEDLVRDLLEELEGLSNSIKLRAQSAT